jgi:hypothetical protein
MTGSPECDDEGEKKRGAGLTPTHGYHISSFVPGSPQTASRIGKSISSSLKISLLLYNMLNSI